MITPSLIYAGITILLALVEAIRFKVRWGKVANINHKVSEWLAIAGAVPVLWFWIANVDESISSVWWKFFVAADLIGFAFIAIRLAIYDPLLNFLRILTKTNPTMRLDYVSTETSSYEDQHSEKLGFWQKRALGVTAWAVLFVIYSKIFMQ